MTEESPNLRSATVEGLRWTAVARPAIEIVLLGSMVVLARLIPPAEFGRFAVVILVAELAVLIPNEGVGSALVQRATVRREHLQAGFALALLAGLALTGLALLAAATFVGPVFGSRTAHLLLLSTPGILIPAVGTVPMAILRRRLAFRTMTMIDLTMTTTRAAASVGLALAGLDAEALILGGLIAGVLGTGMAWLKAPSPAPRLERSAARDVLSYGLPASLASVSWVGFRNCDYAIVGARLGAVQAGYYFRAYTLAVEYQKKVSLVMGQVGFPVLARARSAEEMAAMRTQMVRVLTAVLFPLLAVLAVTAPVLVPWVFGPAWAPAVLPTQILALGGASTLVIDCVGAGLMAAGRARALLGYGVAHFAVYAAAVLIVAPLGLAAVAGAAAVVHTAFLVVAYVLLLHGSHERPLRRLWDDVAPATASCLALGAIAVPASLAMSAAQVPTLPHLVAVGLLAAAAYLVTLRVCFPATWRSLLTIAGRVIPVRARRGATRRLDPAPARSAL
jgi:O-antigen/teichoic acid export membrane protein